MKVEITLTGILKYKAKFESKILETDSSKTIKEVLQEMEKDLDVPLGLFKNDELQNGLILFYRSTAGGLTRVMDLSQKIRAEYGKLVITTSMAGG